MLCGGCVLGLGLLDLCNRSSYIDGVLVRANGGVQDAANPTYLIAVFIRRFTGMDFSDQRWWHFFHSVSVMAMLRLIASAVEPSVLWRTPRTI